MNQHILRRPHGTKEALNSAFFQRARRALVLCTLAGLASGCGAGRNQPITYSVGGTISGLTASGLILANDSETVSPPPNATLFVFPSRLAPGKSYTVMIQSQPSGETCTVSSASGTVNSVNVNSVAVNCVETYSVGGSISGLTASGLILANGSDTVSLTPNATAFTFSARLASGQAYSVTVQSQPIPETCTITAGAGTAGSANITSIAVSCVTEHVIYSFAAPADGALPVAGLIQGTDGTFYGATPYGGTSQHGTVFTVTQAGDERVLYSFTGASGDGARPVASLIQGSDGNIYGTTSSGGASSPTCPISAGCGTVFRIAPSGAETVLHSFAGAGNDGASPVASLIQGSDGNFYGTTSSGGASSPTCPISGGCGTVFRIAPSGAETVLHSFAGAGNDGASPVASLIQGSDGNFYGTTSIGGAVSSSFPEGCGTVFRITPAGVETLLYSFKCSGGDGVDPLAGLIQGGDGNFYGTTNLGGASGEGTVFKITPAGSETVLYSFNGGACEDDINPGVSLIQGNDGNLYGTTSGNANSCSQGTVFKITPAGVETEIYSFKGDISLGANPRARLLQGSDGSLYGTTEYGGAGQNGTVFMISL